MAKKLILFLLALCIVVTCFACTGDKDDKKDNGKTPTTDPVETIDPWTELPDVTYEGADFKICTREGYANMEVLSPDENSTNMLDIALTNRNTIVEDRFDVFITPITKGGLMGQQINDVLAACVGNTGEFDLAMTYVFESSPLATNGYLYNWNQLEYTHLDRSYWMNDMNKAFAIKDVIYTTVGKMCVSSITNTFAFFYNRTLGESFKETLTEEMFALIRSGDWTWDNMLAIVEEFGWSDTDDINGASEGDTYGMNLSLDWSIDTWHAAWEIPMIQNDVETGLKNVYMSNKLLDYADRMHEAYYNNSSILAVSSGAVAPNFANGKALFSHNWLNAALNNYADMEDVYTIIPYPKYDDSQEQYRTPSVDNYSVMCVPTSADDEMVSVLVEALNIQSEEILYPAYYYEALHKKTISDPDTNEMLDIILNNMSYDIATLLHAEVHLMDLVRIDVIQQANNVKGTYDSMKSTVDDSIEYIMEQFEEFREQ